MGIQRNATHQLEGPSKQRQGTKCTQSKGAWPCFLLPAPPLPTEQMGHIPTPATPGQHPSTTHLFGSCWSCLLAHPVPSLGTITMLGSFPLFSDFRLGRFAGGGIRRAVATFPRLCKPCLGITARKSTWDRTHTSQEERGQFAPLLSLQVRKTKLTKCLAVALAPASSSPDYRDKGPLNCIGRNSVAGGSWHELPQGGARPRKLSPQ